MYPAAGFVYQDYCLCADGWPIVSTKLTNLLNSLAKPDFQLLPFRYRDHFGENEVVGYSLLNVLHQVNPVEAGRKDPDVVRAKSTGVAVNKCAIDQFAVCRVKGYCGSIVVGGELAASLSHEQLVGIRLIPLETDRAK